MGVVCRVGDSCGGGVFCRDINGFPSLYCGDARVLMDFEQINS